MGSPVSVAVAEVVMQNIGEPALATCTRTIPLWLRYVYDTFTAAHKNKIEFWICSHYTELPVRWLWYLPH